MSQVNPNEPFAAFVRSPERFWYELFLINPTPDVYRETFTVSGGYVSGKTLYRSEEKRSSSRSSGRSSIDRSRRFSGNGARRISGVTPT